MVILIIVLYIYIYIYIKKNFTFELAYIKSSITNTTTMLKCLKLSQKKIVLKYEFPYKKNYIKYNKSYIFYTCVIT